MAVVFFSGPLACAAEKIPIVSLLSVLTEIASEVGGDAVQVTGLVPAGTDPHDFQPSPSDLKAVASAQLILASGKHLEGYLVKLQESSGNRGTLIQVGDRLPSLPLLAGDDHDHGTMEDPHWWQSIANVRLATEVVRDELIKAAPDQRALFQKNATAYLDQLAALQKWAALKIAELPRNQRKLVTTHDAFQYFARDYGFTIYGIEGFSTDAEPSSQQVIAIIDLIQRQHVKAIFAEFSANPKVTTEITRETGVKIAGSLYADGLGTGDAATYDGMFRHNVTTIVDALK